MFEKVHWSLANNDEILVEKIAARSKFWSQFQGPRSDCPYVCTYEYSSLSKLTVHCSLLPCGMENGQFNYWLLTWVCHRLHFWRETASKGFLLWEIIQECLLSCISYCMRPTSVLLHLSAAVSSFKSLARAPWIRSDYLKLSSASQAHMSTNSQSTCSFDNIIDGARWIDLEISPIELRPNYTLIMGQCFNWKRIDNADTDGVNSTCWIGILGKYPLAIRQTDETTLFANLMDSRALHTSIATSNCPAG